MPAKLIERLELSEDDYRFGAVAVRSDNAALVVITEIPEAEGFPAVNVSELEIDEGGELLRAAGSIPLDQLRVLHSQAPWPVDRVAAAIVRGEFGEDAAGALVDGFRDIFERQAGRAAVVAA